VLKRLSSRRLKDSLDDMRLERLATPLQLASPREVIERLKTWGGVQLLFSQEAETAISSFMVWHHVDEALGQLSTAVAAILKAHRRGQLAVSLTIVARGLATILMSSFMPRSDCLRRDLATILSGNPGDGVGLIARYRRAVLTGDTRRVEAVDQRIMLDAMWGSWAQVLLREGGEIAGPQRPTTHWEFMGPPMSGDNANGLRRWLFRR
jgi:hypothetical protein